MRKKSKATKSKGRGLQEGASRALCAFFGEKAVDFVTGTGKKERRPSTSSLEGGGEETSRFTRDSNLNA